MNSIDRKRTMETASNNTWESKTATKRALPVPRPAPKFTVTYVSLAIALRLNTHIRYRRSCQLLFLFNQILEPTLRWWSPRNEHGGMCYKGSLSGCLHFDLPSDQRRRRCPGNPQSGGRHYRQQPQSSRLVFQTKESLPEISKETKKVHRSDSKSLQGAPNHNDTHHHNISILHKTYPNGCGASDCVRQKTIATSVVPVPETISDRYHSTSHQSQHSSSTQSGGPRSQRGLFYHSRFRTKRKLRTGPERGLYQHLQHQSIAMRKNKQQCVHYARDCNYEQANRSMNDGWMEDICSVYV